MILGGSRTRGTSGALQKWHVQKDVEGFYHVAAAFLIQIACVTPKNQCSNIAGFRASVLYTKLRSRRKRKQKWLQLQAKIAPPPAIVSLFAWQHLAALAQNPTGNHSLTVFHDCPSSVSSASRDACHHALSNPSHPMIEHFSAMGSIKLNSIVSCQRKL